MDSVLVQYLGTGGYLVKRGADVALFGPVYTNPGMPEVFFDHELRTEGALVEALLPRAADDAQAIVVGHSHYDHLMDTPYIARQRAKRANIYGSQTTVALLDSIRGELRSRTPANDVIALDQAAAQRRWVQVPGSAMRILPLPSEHADQFRVKLPGLQMPVHLWRGDALEPRATLPLSVSQWREGAVFTYLLDFLDANGAPVFRVYYQDSGTTERQGFVPVPFDGKQVDVALICVGGDFPQRRGLERHPAGIIKNTRPRYLVLGHWEDFFVTQRTICSDGVVRALPPPNAFWQRSATASFVARAAQAMGGRNRVFLPCPTTSEFNIPVDPAADALAKVGRGTYDCSKLR